MSAWMGLLNVVMVAVAWVLVVPALVLAAEVLAACLRRASLVAASENSPWDGSGSLVVLVPAHNEASGISATLASIKAQLRPGDQILVIADNCTDETAVLARAGGACVVERFDLERRGKGYALDHGVRWLAAQASAPDVVVIVDADCRLGDSCLDRLRAAVARSRQPVQSLDLMHAPEGSPLTVRIAEFAWLVKNQVRPSGLRALGGPCQLMGTGMAFPWAVLRDAPLASGHLAEDLQLGAALATRGHLALFCSSASVHSEFPANAEGIQAQRQRWEQGHLSVIRHQGLALLGRGIQARQPALVALALDLMVPPLASLVLLQTVMVLLTLVWGGISGSWLALTVSALGLGCVGLAVMAAWRGWARHIVSAADLRAVPTYVLAKLPLYRAALRGLKPGWQRAARERD